MLRLSSAPLVADQPVSRLIVNTLVLLAELELLDSDELASDELLSDDELASDELLSDDELTSDELCSEALDCAIDELDSAALDIDELDSDEPGSCVGALDCAADELLLTTGLLLAIELLLIIELLLEMALLLTKLLSELLDSGTLDVTELETTLLATRLLVLLDCGEFVEPPLLPPPQAVRLSATIGNTQVLMMDCI